MPTELNLEGDEVYSAQVELLIKILAIQKATASFICDKFAKTETESDEFYDWLVAESNQFGREILADLSLRRGKIDLNEILKNR